MIDIESELSNRCQADKTEATMLKSRRFTFIDPHGHPISTQQLDHESMDVVIKRFRNDYIPRFLKEWIKIGSAYNEVKLKSFVHDYPDGQQFVAYGQITVWAHVRCNFAFKSIVLSVQLCDSMEEIKSRLESRCSVADLELRSCRMQADEKPRAEHWENGHQLQSNDTIMSCKFYEKDQRLLVKVILEQSCQITCNVSALHI